MGTVYRFSSDKTAILNYRRSKGKKTVVFTNGCFDLLHPGHLDLLEFCCSIDPNAALVVGLNSDSSVKHIKGPSRPIVSEDDRARILTSLKIDLDVAIFDEPSPLELLTFLNPDFIIKGGDYHVEDVVANDGAKVIIFPYRDGYSTSSTVEKILKRD